MTTCEYVIAHQFEPSIASEYTLGSVFIFAAFRSIVNKSIVDLIHRVAFNLWKSEIVSLTIKDIKNDANRFFASA